MRVIRFDCLLVSILSRETIISIFPAISKGWTYFGYKIYIFIVTDRRIALIYVRDCLPRRRKLWFLCKTIIGGLIAAAILGLPGVAAGASLASEDFMSEVDLDKGFDVNCIVSSSRLEKLVSSRKKSYFIPLDKIKSLWIDFENSTFKLKVGWRSKSFIVDRRSLAQLASLVKILS